MKPDLRQDPISLDWLIVSPRRAKRPHPDSSKKILCPFDVGNEAMTPPEAMRVSSGDDKEDWQVRVVPNLYPVTEIHEVIIHSPDHKKDLMELPIEHVEKIFQVFQDRYNANLAKGLPLIFNNHGPDSGASLPHPHSQLAVIPAEVGTTAPLAQKPHNIAVKGKSLVVFCPDFSTWPYETWIQPFPRGKKFGQADESQLVELAHLTQQVLQALDAAHQDLAYNFYIYPSDDWYLRIVGRSIVKGGFELGSGVQVNAVDPKEVVRILS